MSALYLVVFLYR